MPWIDAKYYAGTQTMDEARHVEVFSRYLHEKLEWEWPINESLKELLDATIKDSRWDFKYLGMQIIIEGLAMAAFGNLYQVAQEPLLKELIKYVMKDESRHVAFGVLSLTDYYQDMPANELRDREDFVIYACELMRNRLVGDQIARAMGWNVEELRAGGARVAARQRLPPHALRARRPEPEAPRPDQPARARGLHDASASSSSRTSTRPSRIGSSGWRRRFSPSDAVEARAVDRDLRRRRDSDLRSCHSRERRGMGHSSNHPLGLRGSTLATSRDISHVASADDSRPGRCRRVRDSSFHLQFGWSWPCRLS